MVLGTYLKRDSLIFMFTGQNFVSFIKTRLRVVGPNSQILKWSVHLVTSFNEKSSKLYFIYFVNIVVEDYNLVFLKNKNLFRYLFFHLSFLLIIHFVPFFCLQFLLSFSGQFEKIS